MTLTAPFIDTNITLGQWPTRRSPCDVLDKLVAKLQAHSVTEAWVGHYDGLFHADLTEVNNRLALACTYRMPLAPPASSSASSQSQPPKKTPPKLVPFGSLNPTAPNWEAELDRCVTVHKMPGIRLHPNYHNYKLDHPSLATFLKAAADRKLIVQLAALMEDARMMHPLMRVAPVDLSRLEKFVQEMPGLRLVLLNALTNATRTDKLYRLINSSQIYVDIAMLESLTALETLVHDVPLDRALFGSHSPSFYMESAHLKLQEADLPTEHRRAIMGSNARNLLPVS